MHPCWVKAFISFWAAACITNSSPLICQFIYLKLTACLFLYSNVYHCCDLMYAFARCFYSKQLPVHSRYTCILTNIISQNHKADKIRHNWLRISTVMRTWRSTEGRDETDEIILHHISRLIMYEAPLSIDLLTFKWNLWNRSEESLFCVSRMRNWVCV